MEPGTVFPLHRHRVLIETVVVLRGKVRQNFYDGNGQLTESFEVSTGGEIVGFSVELARWHNTECLESGTVILECKDGRNRWNKGTLELYDSRRKLSSEL